MTDPEEPRWVLRLGAPERELLHRLLDELAAAVAPPPAGADPLEQMVGIAPASRPEDPAVLRLFPDGYATPEEAAEFRRYTEVGLRRAKADSATLVLASLDADPIVLALTDALAWLRTLNDLRLMLGTTLGVSADEDEMASILAADPDRYAEYEFLGWLQQSLIDQLDDA